MITGTSATRKLLSYQVSNVVRSRWLISYTLFFVLATEGLLRFSSGTANALLSLVSLVLLLIPLVTVVFGTVYFYNAREFTELLLAQPVGRPALYTSFLVGLTLPLSAGFAAGIGIPFLLHGVDEGSQRGALAALLAAGIALTCIFTAIAFVIAVRSEDRLKGLGTAISVWLICAVLYDGGVLLVAALFGNRAIEVPLLGLMMANPIDLARVFLLLQFDTSALLGYTGAVFRQVFAGVAGMVAAASVLLVWVAVPTIIGARAFRRKDF